MRSPHPSLWSTKQVMTLTNNIIYNYTYEFLALFIQLMDQSISAILMLYVWSNYYNVFSMTLCVLHLKHTYMHIVTIGLAHKKDSDECQYHKAVFTFSNVYDFISHLTLHPQGHKKAACMLLNLVDVYTTISSPLKLIIVKPSPSHPSLDTILTLLLVTVVSVIRPQ